MDMRLRQNRNRWRSVCVWGMIVASVAFVASVVFVASIASVASVAFVSAESMWTASASCGARSTGMQLVMDKVHTNSKNGAIFILWGWVMYCDNKKSLSCFIGSTMVRHP